MLIKIFQSLLLAVVLILPAWGIDSAPAFDDPIMMARYNNLTRQLRCLVCQNETIADSNATLAGDLRHELREQLASGKSDDEVLKFMTDRYGAFVLYQPPFEARTWLLWLGPAVLLLGGLAIAVRIIMKRAKLPIEDGPMEDNDSNNSSEGNSSEGDIA
jgi:cytochrome c-type biogenesis protein CcmH